MCLFAALGTRRDNFQKHAAWLNKHPPFGCIMLEEIVLRHSDNLDIEIRFFFAFSLCSIFGGLILFQMSSGRHPTLEALVPKKQRTFFGIDDEGRCRKMTNKRSQRNKRKEKNERKKFLIGF